MEEEWTEFIVEVAFWGCFALFLLYSRGGYWQVLFVTFFILRFWFTALSQWTCFPPKPWNSVGKMIITTFIIFGWLFEGAIFIYALSISPIHILFSPMQIWTRYVEDREPISAVEVVYESQEVTVEYATSIGDLISS